jgi:iron complex outermembrane receptor protein
VLRGSIRLVLLLLLIFSESQTFAQTSTQISGTITDEQGAPLFGVTVFIHEVSKSSQTNDRGEFNISGIRPGNYHLHLHLIGFKAAEIDLTVSETNQPLKIKLQQASIELNNITIEESILKSGQREQSQSMQVVDKDFMLKNGNASLVKILENIPGVSSINTGMGVSKPVIRGLGFNRVVVAENGIKQEGQQWGGDHGLEIDQFAVDRVEVLKGPSSLIYGSDGIGGLVNIRPAPAPELNTSNSALLLTGRSVNDFMGISGMTSINKNDYFFRTRISIQNYADYRVPADSFIYNSYILPIENKRLKNTAGRERNAQMMFGTSKKWGFSTLTFSLFDQKVGLFSGAHGIPRSYQLKHDSTYRDIDLPYQRVQHYKAISNTSLMIGKHWMEIDLGYQYNHRREFSYPHAHGKGPQPQGDVELEFKLQTITSNARFHYEGKNNFKWVIGINSSVQQNRIAGFSFLIPEYTNFSSGTFAFVRKEMTKDLIFNAGIRYDYGNIRADRYLRPIYEDSITISGYTQASPNINRNFNNASGSTGVSWFPSEKVNVKFNFGSGFRMPTAPELTANGIHHGSFRHEMGDSTLTSERGYQSDLLVKYASPNWEISLSPYFNYFDGFIFLDPTAEFSLLPDAGLLYRFNQADAIHYGAEFQSDFHISEHFHFGLSGQYVAGRNLETSYSLPFMPPAQLRSDIEYEWEKWGKHLQDIYIGLQWQGVFDQNDVARNEPETPGFNLFNLNFGTGIQVGDQTWKLVLNIQNVFNTKYYAHLNRYRMLNLPEAGRNVMFSLLIPFKSTLKP